jgi:hypothetical protein
MDEFLMRADFRKHFIADRVLIDWVAYKLEVQSNFSLSNRFPEFFLVSYDEDGLINAVSYHIVFIDKARDWERHDLEVYCSSTDACLKHHAFFLHSVLESQQCQNVHCITLVPQCLVEKTDFESLLEKIIGMRRSPLSDPAGDINYIPLVSDTGYFQ